MKNLDMLLSRFDAMSDDEMIALLKKALTISDIPYITGPGPVDLLSLLPNVNSNSDSCSFRISRSTSIDTKCAYYSNPFVADYTMERVDCEDDYSIKVTKNIGNMLVAA